MEKASRTTFASGITLPWDRGRGLGFMFHRKKFWKAEKFASLASRIGAI